MNILDEILAAFRSEERVMLATVISTTGSTPAGAYSKMLLKSGGALSVGTVGGGCMEGEVILRANRLSQSAAAEIATFHLNEDENEQGLICGGSLDVLIEPLARSDIPLVEHLRDLYYRGEDCVLATILDEGGIVKGRYVAAGSSAGNLRFAGEEEPTSLFPGRAAEISEAVNTVQRRKQTARIRLEHGQLILQPFIAAPALIIFGGGHVSGFLTRAASMAGFRVTVVDDREKYANKERFPLAEQTLAVDFHEAFRLLSVDSSAYIAIVTRGHKFDEEILEQALRTGARYIGMIGSKRKVLATFEHLLDRGVPIESLRRVHAPMGIEIGAVTAEEIAISIIAQLINVRREGALTIHYKSDDTRILLQSLEQKHLIA